MTYPQGGKIDFCSDVQKYMEQVIYFWKTGEEVKLKSALGNFVIYSIMSVDMNPAILKTNILSKIPYEIDARSIPAYIYLLDMRDKGIDLRPSSFFEGRSFTIIGAQASSANGGLK
jgi:hypothetical protein